MKIMLIIILVLLALLTSCTSRDEAVNQFATSVINDDVLMIKSELKHNPDFAKQTDPQSGDSMLTLAARFASIEAVDLILEYGADPNYLGGSHTSPMHAAASRGDIDIFVLLHEHRGNLELYGPDGQNGKRTVLAIATIKQNTEVVNYLLSEGADPNATASGDTRTPAHHAFGPNARAKFVIPILRMLKQYSADFDLKDSMGRTVLDIAKLHKQESFYWAALDNEQ